MSEAAAAVHQAVVGAQSVDGLKPLLSVTPTSLVEVQSVLCDAHRDGHAVIPIGSGGRLEFGNVPAAYHTALLTSSLDKIVAYEPADMTVTVEAGVTLKDLQAVLAERGQYLPIDVCGPSGTVGGLLGANAFGALRHRYGTARDWLIGLRVVHADGSTSKSGGRVVKNVSGYDLHKVHIGALGSLGIIAEATFKVAPLPKADLTFVLGCPSASAAASIITECHERGLSLVAAELMSPTDAHAVEQPSQWTALLRIAGGSAAVVRTVRDVRDLATLAEADMSELDGMVWDRWRTALSTDPLRLRVSVPPTRVPDTAEAIDRRFAGDGVALSATATVGLLRVTLRPRDDARATAIIDQVKAITATRNGHAVVDAAPPDVKRSIDVFGPARSDLAIMRRLKTEFDPTTILSSGRFMGRL